MEKLLNNNMIPSSNNYPLVNAKPKAGEVDWGKASLDALHSVKVDEPMMSEDELAKYR